MRRLLIALAIAAATLAPSAGPSAAQVPPEGIGRCVVSFNWTTGAGSAGSGTCVGNAGVVPVKLVNTVAPGAACPTIFNFALQGAGGPGSSVYVQWQTGGNWLNGLGSLFGATRPSIRNGGLHVASVGASSVGDATFLGVDTCATAEPSLHGTMLINVVPIAYVLDDLLG